MDPEIIEILDLVKLPKGPTFKVILAGNSSDAIKEYQAKHAKKYGDPGQVFKFGLMFYFKVEA